MTRETVILSILYPECHFMLTVAKKPVMLSVIMQNVMAPFKKTNSKFIIIE